MARLSVAAVVVLSAGILVAVVAADVPHDRGIAHSSISPAASAAPAFELQASPPPPAGAALLDREPQPFASPAPMSEGKVPILYYHRVKAPPKGFWTWSQARRNHVTQYEVLPSAFAAQLDWLTAHGYTAILPRDLADHWDQGVSLPAKPVIITFDDGTPDWAQTVLPLLRSHGMVAEFYLTLDAIRMHGTSWADIQALAAAGNGIGAHDVHHVQLTNLGHGRPDASVATMRSEVTDIRAVIAAHVGVAPDSMAYVGGGYNATLMDVARQAGYTTARTTVSGIQQTVAHRYSLRVVHVGWQEDVANERLGTMTPDLPAFARSIGEPTKKAADPRPVGPKRAGTSGSMSPS